MSKIQNADVKSLAQLQAAGATVAELINDTKIYVTANSINKQLSQAIIDGEIGAGSGGGVNFIAKGSADLATTSIFVPYKDAAATRPVDGTGGTSTVTTSVSSTTPLSGSKSFLLTKPASNTQGEGWAIPFTVDLAYRAKSVRIEFDYIVNSGTFVAGSQSTDSDVIWYIYDVTNSQLIEPSNIKMLANSTSLADKFQATFQTSATGSSYRLIAHCATTSALAYELKVDNITVSPQSYIFGTPGTDWESYTPVISGLGSGTYTLQYAKWRRNGPDLLVQIKGQSVVAGTGSSPIEISLPTGLSADYTVRVGVGTIQFYNGSVHVLHRAIVEGDKTKVRGLSSGTNNYLLGSEMIANADFTIDFTIKIEGFSASVQMSDSADTRVVAARYTHSAGSSINSASSTLVDFANKIFDTHNAVTTGASWKFTAPVSGIYQISALLTFASASFGVNTQIRCDLFKNGSVVQRLGFFRTEAASGADIPSAQGTSLIQLNAGDYVHIEAYQDNGTAKLLQADATFNWINISRLSGPSAIAASETVAMRAAGTPTGTLSASFNKITWPTVQVDTHGGYSSGTYTVSSPGLYEVSAQVSITGGTIAEGNPCAIQLKKSGSAFSTNLIRAALAGANGTAPVAAVALIRCVAGDTLEAFSYTAYGTPSYSQLLDASEFYFSVRRVGN